MGAMQAQDFAAAKWGVGLRATRVTEADVDSAFNAGRILRTHVLRPTWHFVAPRDIRWMLSVSGPRVQALNAHYYRKMGADRSLLTRSRAALERALQGGTALTRNELAAVFAGAGAPAQGQLLAYLMMHAELDGVICSGPRRGKQFTYMLLDERVPAASQLHPDEALAELARRYFTSHAPATMRDFAWWSGMTIADTKRALSMIGAHAAGDSPAGERYWTTGAGRKAAGLSAIRPVGTVDLLPIYDEYLIAYRDRSAFIERAASRRLVSHDPYAHFLMIDGRLAGTWRRAEKKGVVQVCARPYRTLSKKAGDALTRAVHRYSSFLEREAVATV
jgi:hypothetical protein